MPKIVVKNDDGSCTLSTLRPYPTVSSSDGSVTVTPTTNAQGGVDFNLQATVDVNLANAVYDPATAQLTLTETTGGDTFVLDLSTLRSVVTATLAAGNPIAVHTVNGQSVTIRETVTSAVINGAAIEYTDEAGNVTSLGLCALLSNLPDNGTVVGG